MGSSSFDGQVLYAHDNVAYRTKFSGWAVEQASMESGRVTGVSVLGSRQGRGLGFFARVSDARLERRASSSRGVPRRIVVAF